MHNAKIYRYDASHCFGLQCAQYKGIKTNIHYNLTIPSMPVAKSGFIYLEYIRCYALSLWACVKCIKNWAQMRSSAFYPQDFEHQLMSLYI